MKLKLLLLLLLALPLLTAASTIRRMTLGELVRDAELVFEGRVVAREVVHEPGSRTLRTRVTFEVLDRIKGGAPGGRVTLSFLGGQAHGASLRVSDMRIPAVGEHGIYFVESLDRLLVNPLLGWHQGHYLIDQEPAVGRALVRTLDGRPVFDLEAGTLPSTAISRGGGAAGVVVQPRAPLEKPLDPAGFKARLRLMVEAQ